MSKASVRQSHGQTPSSVLRPKNSKVTDRKPESSLVKGRPRSRLSTASPPASVNTIISNPRSSSRLSLTHSAYASSPSSLSSSSFQSEIDEDESLSKAEKTRIPRPVQRNQSRPNASKTNGRKYYRHKQIDTILTHLASYYRSRHVTAQIEEAFKAVEHQMPTRYLNTSSQLTPPPSRSREDSNRRGMDIPTTPEKFHLQCIESHRPITPLSPAPSLSDTGHLSPASGRSQSPSSSEAVSSDRISREPSPLYCEELSTSPLSNSPVDNIYEHYPPHAPVPVPNPIGTILLPIAEVSESQTGASSYPRKRRYEPMSFSVTPSEVSEASEAFESSESSESSESVFNHNSFTPQPKAGAELIQPDLLIENRTSSPTLLENNKVSGSASEILNRDKREKPSRAMSVASIASFSSSLLSSENPRSPTTVIAKGEFFLASSKSTETSIGVSSSAATGELQKIDTASKRTQPPSPTSSATADTSEVARVANTGRLWGFINRWMGW